MNRMCLLLPLLLGATAPQQQEMDEPPPRAPVDPVLGRVVAQKVLACYGAEKGGAISDEDRAAVEQFAAELGGAVGAALGDCGEAGSCGAAAAALSCEDLAQRLSSPDVTGPPESWALTLTGALRARVGTCYAIESGGAPDADSAARVDAFCTGLAGSLSAITIQGACRVNQGALSACVSGIGTQPCGALAAGLSADSQEALSVLADACAGLLDCDLEGSDLGEP